MSDASQITKDWLQATFTTYADGCGWSDIDGFRVIASRVALQIIDLELDDVITINDPTRRQVEAMLDAMRDEAIGNTQAAINDYKAATRHLVSCVLTVQQVNTDDWMEYIVDEINKWADATGEPDRVELAKYGLRIVRGGRGEGLEILRANAVCGWDVGERCNRDGCEGVLEWDFDGECSCHLCPPCGWCVDRRVCCPKCGWRDEE